MPQRSTASSYEHEQATFISTKESGNIIIKCGEKAEYSNLKTKLKKSFAGENRNGKGNQRVARIKKNKGSP